MSSEWMKYLLTVHSNTSSTRLHEQKVAIMYYYDASRLPCGYPNSVITLSIFGFWTTWSKPTTVPRRVSPGLKRKKAWQSYSYEFCPQCFWRRVCDKGKRVSHPAIDCNLRPKYQGPENRFGQLQDVFLIPRFHHVYSLCHVMASMKMFFKKVFFIEKKGFDQEKVM